MKSFEFIIESMQSISNSNDGGSLEGYVVDTNKPQLNNYLTTHRAEDKLIISITNKFQRIAIIKNMYIDDDKRNQGYGKDLLDNAIDDSYNYGAQAILLIADTHEDNAFNLIKWYKNYGFEIIGMAGGDPVMLLDES